jgi:hypothetical protein
LIDPARWCVMFHSRSSVRDFTGALTPNDCSHLLKSRFMPSEGDRAVGVAPLGLVAAARSVEDVVRRVWFDDAQDVGRVGDDRPRLEPAIASSITCYAGLKPRGRVAPAAVGAEEGARDADCAPLDRGV